jgi:hypothetical protein
MPRRLIPLALALSALVCYAQAPAKNLVANPSLETPIPPGRLPLGWVWFSRPEGAYRFSVVNGGHTGIKALQVEGAGEAGVMQIGRVKRETSKRYAARGWFKVEGGEETIGTLSFHYYGAGEKYLGSTYAGFLSPAARGWQLVALTDRAAETPGTLNITATAALSGKGKAWIDDLEMVARDSPAGPPNLLANGDMENISGERLVSWGLEKPEEGEASLRWSDEQPKDGWYSLQLTGSAKSASAESERVKVEKGRAYTLSGYARAKSGSARLRIDYFRENEYLGNTLSEEVVKNEWERRTVTTDPARFPEATHISAVAVGLGVMSVSFDALALAAN